MRLTDIARLVFARRMRTLELHISDGDKLQQEVLNRLVGMAKNTEYGTAHSFGSIKSYEDFARQVPVNTYEELKGDIDRMRHGESDILWPGTVKWYAKSSGTTNDKSKFIPVSKRGLQHLHYAGGTDAVVMYLQNNPKSRIFDGRSLILGGSHSPNYNLSNSLVGDLSSILIENINPLVNLVRVPKKSTALLADFEEKREKIARETLNKDVTNISGVPSWMLSVLTRVMELSGKQHLEEVWPNLEVFFHGGVAFTPYREQYKRLITSPNMHYMETYNASEGFFGLQNDPSDPSMLLMLDYDCFYEFIPMDEIEKENPTVLPIWGVEVGKNYAMVITTSCGLWRYMIGDTIQFTSVKPYKFFISGRTKYFINAFGEELIQDNAEKALDYTCKQTNAAILEYSAAPVFMDGNAKCRHQWLIEFSKEPQNLDEFAAILDKKLQEINSDYEAKRHKDITLQPLEIIKARKDLFNDWLKSKGKLGGQHKIPRLSNTRKYIDEMLTFLSMLLLVVFTSCANMGSPQGGLYDEDPPKILYCTPADKGTNVHSNKVSIYFNEFVKIENASEKVIVSPPQLEMPEIKDQGKKIIVELKDTLKPDITYTIDFSDAIVDFTESNPLGNYTYSFSTGEKIDTFEVSGVVLDASNLEPIKGILVGLYDDLSDTVFTKKPLQRVARTDSRGHFVVRGIAPGTYRAYALKDADGDYLFTQKSEMIAFNHDTFQPACGPATRQDTIWRDSLHIESIKQVPYTRFTPDDLVLLAFTETNTDRHLIKTDRTEANQLKVFFSYGHDSLPTFTPLNFKADSAIILEASEKNDTITYWLADTALVNNDSLTVELQYMMTDTTGLLISKTDTIEFIPKFSYEKRQKLAKEEYDKWFKAQKKLKKKGESLDSIMPIKAYEPKYNESSTLAPDQIYTITMPTPLAKLDTSAIHLYAKIDTSWYRAPFLFRPSQSQGQCQRQFEIIAEWREGAEYSLEIDSAAFIDIYGLVSDKKKIGIKIGSQDDYSSLLVNITGINQTLSLEGKVGERLEEASSLYVELLNSSDEPEKKVKVERGSAEFYYLKAGTYYLRAFEDRNGNGIWDTGLFSADIQPERVYYYNKEVECKEKWDVTIDWNFTTIPMSQQKPAKITKQKGEKEKTIKNRNAEYIRKYRKKK